MPLISNPGTLSEEALLPGRCLNTAPRVERHTCLFAKENLQANVGGLPFGRAVISADLDGPDQKYARYGCKLPEAGGKFIGIVFHTEGVEGLLGTDPLDYDKPRGYKPDQAVPVVFKGGLGVGVVTAVSPGDPVFINVSTGVDNGLFRANAGTGGIEIPQASWRGTGESGDVVGLYIDIVV